MSAFLNLIIPIVEQIFDIRYNAVAAVSIVVYDYFLTLDLEIEHIWKSRWSIGKVLFLINRYYTLTFDLIFYINGQFNPHLSDAFCLRWWRWGGGSGVFTFALAQMILQLRLYALYGKSKKLLIFMGGCFFIAIATSATLLGFAFVPVVVPSHVIPGVPFCTPIGDVHLFWTIWIPLLAMEAMLCGLAVYRGISLYRLHGTTFRLVEFLVRDSVFYFIIIFVVYFTNTLVFVFAAEAIWECTAIFTVAIASTMANRLLLNVREMAHSNDETPVAQVHHASPPPRFPATKAQQSSTTGITTEYTLSTVVSDHPIPQDEVEVPVFPRDFWQNHMVNISQPNATSTGIVTFYEMNEMQGSQVPQDPSRAV